MNCTVAPPKTEEHVLRIDERDEEISMLENNEGNEAQMMTFYHDGEGEEQRQDADYPEQQQQILLQDGRRDFSSERNLNEIIIADDQTSEGSFIELTTQIGDQSQASGRQYGYPYQNRHQPTAGRRIFSSNPANKHTTLSMRLSHQHQKHQEVQRVKTEKVSYASSTAAYSGNHPHPRASLQGNKKNSSPDFTTNKKSPPARINSASVRQSSGFMMAQRVLPVQKLPNRSRMTAQNVVQTRQSLRTAANTEKNTEYQQQQQQQQQQQMMVKSIESHRISAEYTQEQMRKFKQKQNSVAAFQRRSKDLHRKEVLSKAYSSTMTQQHQNQRQSVTHRSRPQTSNVNNRASIKHRAAPFQQEQNYIQILKEKRPAMTSLKQKPTRISNRLFEDRAINQREIEGVATYESFDKRTAQNIKLRGSEYQVGSTRQSPQKLYYDHKTSQDLRKASKAISRVFRANSRPRTGYKIRSNRLDEPNDLLSKNNYDLESAARRQPLVNQSGSIPQQNGSRLQQHSIINNNGRTTDMSQQHNRQHNRRTIPSRRILSTQFELTENVEPHMDESSCDEVVVDGGIQNIDCQNLNQVSASSIVLSENQVTNPPRDATHLSQQVAHNVGLHQHYQSAREQQLQQQDDQTILSVTFKPNVPRQQQSQVHQQQQVSQTLRARPFSQKQNSYNNRNSTAIKHRKQTTPQQLILFTGSGDQVKLDVSALQTKDKRQKKTTVGLKARLHQALSSSQHRNNNSTNDKKSISSWVLGRRQTTQNRILSSQHINFAALADPQRKSTNAYKTYQLTTRRSRFKVMENKMTTLNNDNTNIMVPTPAIKENRYDLQQQRASQTLEQKPKQSLTKEVDPVVVNDYTVERETESVLDYYQNHRGGQDSLSSLGRAGDKEDKGTDDLIKYGSVQKIQDDADRNSHSTSRKENEKNYRAATTNDSKQLTQQVIKLNKTDEFHSSILIKTKLTNSQGGNQLNKKKQVSIKEEQIIRPRHQQRHNNNNHDIRAAREAVQDLATVRSQKHSQHSHQGKFHQLCSHNSSINSSYSGLKKIDGSQAAKSQLSGTKATSSAKRRQRSPALACSFSRTIQVPTKLNKSTSQRPRIKKQVMAQTFNKQQNNEHQSQRSSLLNQGVNMHVTKGSFSLKNSGIKHDKARNSTSVWSNTGAPKDLHKLENYQNNSMQARLYQSFLGSQHSKIQKPQQLISNLNGNQRALSVTSSQMHSQSNSNYKKILNRKFQLKRDLSKYSRDLHFLSIDRRLNLFSKTVRGNVIQKRKLSEQKTQRLSKWAQEREAMKKVDWEDSDLFEAFRESKELRRPIESVLQSYASLKTIAADKMYSDVELQYYIQLIQKKDCKIDSDEVKQENRSKIVLEYLNRSLYTLQALSKLLKIDFMYERLFKKYANDFKVDTVLMLMTRARKMYQAIEMILTIIKLLDKLKTLETTPVITPDINQDLEPKSPGSLKKAAQIQTFKERIRCAIKSFLAQNTIFPVQFRYGSIDQLSKYRGNGSPRIAESPVRQKTSGGIIDLKVGGHHKDSFSVDAHESKINDTSPSIDAHETQTKKQPKQNDSKKTTQNVS